jgi:hypothetical protein
MATLDGINAPYTLSHRQRHLYTLTAKIYKTTPANTITGDASETYDLRWDNVPCYRNRRPSLYIETMGGRFEHDIFGTNDIWQFPQEVGADLNDGDYLIDVTPGSEDYGKTWIVRGESMTQIKTGDRDGGVTQCMSSIVPANDVPDDVHA